MVHTFFILKLFKLLFMTFQCPLDGEYPNVITLFKKMRHSGYVLISAAHSMFGNILYHDKENADKINKKPNFIRAICGCRPRDKTTF